MSREERGSASLLVAAAAGVLLLVGAALGLVAVIFVDHRSAQAAADLAALAGAAAEQRGLDGCATAADIARRNGAKLGECRVDGHDVRLSAVVRAPRWLGLEADLVGHARAGPR